MRQWLRGLLLGLLIAGVGLILGMSPMGSAFEQRVGLNWLFNARGTVEPPDDVVVVAINGRTGEKLGLPALPRDWPRSIHARLVDELAARGASVIAFDVHFGRGEDPESDQNFVDAVARADNVVLVELLTGKRQPITDAQNRQVGMVWTEAVVPPFAKLAEAARGLASFPLPKQEAAVYQFWTFKESTDQAPTLPAVALQLHARDALSDLIARARALRPESAETLPDPAGDFSDPEQLRNAMRSLHEVFERAGTREDSAPPAIANTPVAIDQALVAMYQGNAHRFVNFYGPPGTIQLVPYQDVLNSTAPETTTPPFDFSNKVVFVGYADLFDPGQPDRFYTIFTRDDGVDLSGVEIAATSFANLLTDRSLTPAGAGTSLAIFVVFPLILCLALYRLPAYLGVPFALLATAAYAGGAQYLFNSLAMFVPIATPVLVQTPLAVFLGLFAQYRLERSRGQRISEAINYYLPNDVARDLTQFQLDPDKMNQVVYGACLATDMAGFSTLSERLPPRELATVLNDYFDTLAAPLKKHGVQVTEFRADAIMCAWTAEAVAVEPRRHALLAALDAGTAIEDFRQRHQMPEARLRIGLEAGWVYVGHAGGGGRFVYSIVGDSANTASRVEGLNKYMLTQVLATGAMVADIDHLTMRYLGDFQFVGKAETIPIYEVLATRESANDTQMRLCESFDTGFKRYLDADWAGAAAHFNTMLEEFTDDGPTRFYLARCQEYLDGNEPEGDPRLIRMDKK